MFKVRMKKLYLFLVLLCLQAATWGQTTATIYCTGASTAFNSGFVNGTYNVYSRNANAMTLIDNRSTTTARDYGWVVFDLSSIPQGATVTAVTYGYYVSTYTAGVAPAFSYDLGYPGDLSLCTDVGILFNQIRYNRLGWGPVVLNQTAGSTAFGTATGNQTQNLLSGSSAATTFFQQNAGGKVSVCMYMTSTASGATRQYTVAGEAGAGGSSTSAANHVPYLQITYTAPSSCSGTPATANVACSPRAANNTNSMITMGLSGSTVATGLTYQWQKSTTSSTSGFTNISGATQANYSQYALGATTTTYFRCIVTCTGSSTSTTSNVDSVMYMPPASCVPTVSTSYYPDYIVSSTSPLGGMSNYPVTMAGESGTTLLDSCRPSTKGFADHTADVNYSPVTIFKTYTHKLKWMNSYYSMGLSVWIDFNGNGTFESTENVGTHAAVGTTGTPRADSMTLSAAPTGAVTGYVRMRIVSSYYGITLSTFSSAPCASLTYGDCRDYLINIQNPPPTLATSPTSIAFSAIPVSSTSATSSTAMAGSFLLPTSGSLTITPPANFDVSPDGSTWTSYGSAYTQTYTAGSTSAPIYVRFNGPASVGTYTGSIAITGGGLSSTVYVPVSGITANPCSGTPTAGTVSVSSTYGGSSTVFNFTLTGYTAAAGISFQWQTSTDSSSWSNISGATSTTYSYTGLTATKYVQCIVTCSYSSTSATSNGIKLLYYPSSGCTPSFSSATLACSTYGMVAATSANPFRINGASSTSITDNTTCSGSGYTDQSTTSGMTGLILNAATSYGVTFGTSGSYGMTYQVYVDFNRNGLFETTESVGGIAASSTASATWSTTITIPSAAAAGLTPGRNRMRIIAEYYSSTYTYPNIIGCPTSASYTYGEARDYSITLNVPPVATVTPTAITFPPQTTGTPSSAITASLTGSYLLPSSGNFTLTAPSGFEISSDGSTWASSYAVSYTASTLGATTIYTRINPPSSGTYTGTLTISGGGVSVAPYVVLNGVAATACSGTPSGGTSSSSSPISRSGLGFTLSVTGYSVSGGIQFQWQSSADGSSWSDITGATLSSYTISAGITSSTYYRCNVTCSYSSTTTASSTTMVTYLPASSCSPAPTFSNAALSCSSYGMVCATTTYPFRINGESSTSITDATGCNGTGYTDQTTTSGMTSLILNAATTYGVTFGTSGSYGMSYQVWIDFNNNGTFETTESVGGISSSTTGSVTWSGTITLPSGATIAPGVRRMRIEGVYYGNTLLYPNIAPCPTTANSSYGEVRDYVVTVAVPPTYTLSPTSMAFGTNDTTAASSAMTATLTGSYLVPSSGNYTVTAPTGFQVSPDGSTWTTSYSVAYSGSSIASSSVYVRFKPTNYVSYTGSVTISGAGWITNPTIAVSGTGGPMCSGTPGAGVSVAYPSGGTASTVIALGLTGVSSVGGLTYQWQSSSTGTGGWSDITGATNSTYVFSGLSATTYYQCIVTCSISSSSATSTSVRVTRIASSSCTPVFYYGNSSSYYTTASATYPLKINGVYGTNLTDNTSLSCSSVCGYVDNTSVSAMTNLILSKGATYTVTTGCQGGSSNMNHQIWIDFNNNGVFETTETMGGANSLSGNVQTFAITIPSSASYPAGGYRMRVEAEYYYHSYSGMNPCPSGTSYTGYYYYGEVRDYLVTVVQPPLPVFSPTSVTFPITTTGTCATTTDNFSCTYLSPASGTVTVSAPSGYQVSPDGSTWTSSYYLISYTGSAISSTPIYIQFCPSTAGTYTGTVTVTGANLASLANLPVSGTAAAACSGTPTAGSAAVSPGYGVGSTAFTLTATGYTVGGGITFQWQKSTDGTSWSNISGATTTPYTYTGGITANTYFRCNVTCSFSSSTASSSSALAYYLSGSSCTPVFYYGPSSTYSWLGTSTYPFKVAGYGSTTMTDPTNTSSSYTDQTGTSYNVTLAAGSTYGVTVGAGSTSYSHSYQIWIDFNRNGSFETSESVGGLGGSSTITSTFNISIPAVSTGITPGYYRMRATSEYYYHSYPSMSPCPTSSSGSYYYGEVRDYAVNIYCPPTAVFTSSSLPFPPTTTGTSSTALSNPVTYYYLTPTSGNVTVTAPSGFQVSPDGSTWTSSYTTSYSTTVVTGNVIYVQFNPVTATTYTGSVTVTGGGLSGAGFGVSGTGAAPCSGTPTAGSISITPASGNSTTAFTATVTGYTSAGGIQFQWQSSTDNATWSNISGASLSTYSFTGITANKYYRCVVTCSYSSSSANTASQLLYYFAPSSCTPVWYYNGCSNYMIVGNASYPFRLVGASGTINDNQNCNAAGYIDSTSAVSSAYTCQLNAGGTYNLTIGANSYAYTMYDQEWIDFNNDGTFQTTESVGGSSGWTGITTSHTISIPAATAGIAPGYYRMRVEAEYNYHAYPNLLPCPNSSSTSNYYGDVRDYKVYIYVPPTATVSPSSLSFAPVETGTCSTPLTSTISAVYLSPSSGSVTLTAPTGYQVSLDGSTYATSYALTYTGSTLASTTVYVKLCPSLATTYSGTVTMTGGGLSGAGIAVTGTGATPCSGTPSAGSASASPSWASASSSFTLSVTGYSVAGGLTFQWQSSTSAYSGFSNISGATNTTYVVTGGISTTMYYQCIVTCTHGGASATSGYTTVSYVPASSCTPASYYTPTNTTSAIATSSTYPFKINGYSGAINDANGPNLTSLGYSDMTASGGSYTCTLAAGSSYTTTIGSNTSAYTQSCQFWIDFNSNGTFESTESVGGQSGWTSVSLNPVITIPSASTGSIIAGAYRMRVQEEYYYHTYPSQLPCPNSSSTSSYYVDTRDYLVTIYVPPTVTASPTSIAFPATVTGTASSAITSTINGYYLSPSAGNLTVTAPTGFRVSADGTTYGTTCAISYTGASVSYYTLYVTFNPSATTTYTGSVAITGGGLSSATNIAVSGTGAVACSGTPTAGTATASPAAGNGTTPFTLSLSGYTTTGGIQFQWQSSASSTSGWSDIYGATLSSYSFTGISASMYYRCVVTCSYSSTSAASNVVAISYYPASSCTPAYYYAANACSYGMVVASASYPLSLYGASGSIVDNHACTGSAYVDYSGSYSVTLNTGTTYGITMGTNTSAYTMSGQVWIDFNNDGTFQSSETVGGGSYTSISLATNITIPSASVVSAGSYRMRVEAEYYYHTYPSQNPCPDGTTANSFYYGEARDYMVTIQVPPTITPSLTTLPFTATCPGSNNDMSLTLTGSYLVPASGNVTITAPSNFSISGDGSTYASSYVMSYTGSGFATTTVYARFSPSAVTSYTGTFTVSGGGATVSLPATGTGAAACSGTPTAGSITATPSMGGASTAFSLSLSGYSVACGITFQWQQSNDGTSWTNITGATLASYNFTGITATKYFQCIVMCAGAGTYSITSPVTVYYLPPSSCTPAWYYGASSCSNYMVVCNASYPFKINGASSTSITDYTACSSGYIDETGTSNTCTLNAGTSYVATLGGNIYGYNMSTQAWIDFNSNGIFESTESVGGGSFTSVQYSPTWTIPTYAAGVRPGLYRMRVEAEYYYHSYPSMSPCPTGLTSASYYYGDVRDYRVTIVVPPTITSTATSIPFTPTCVGSSSATSSFNIGGYYLSASSGDLTITAPSNFLVSADGSTWVSSYTVSYTSSTLGATTVYAQFNPSAITSYTGNIAISGGSATTVNVAVTGDGASACSGTPTAGTASSSPTAGGASTAFTLSLAGYSVACGVTFQWQVSSTGTGGWTNISGATLASYSFTGLTSTTYYQCVVACTASGMSATSNVVPIYYFPASSCTPAWYYGSSSCSNYMTVGWGSGYPALINGYGGTSINDVTACAGGYLDLTSTYIVTFAAGASYVPTIGANIYGYGMSSQTWIDFNSNGVFESTESIGGGSFTSVRTNPTWTLPAASAGVNPGVYRMRVETEYNYHSYPSMNPCPDGTTSGSFYYGEVRDYKVTVVVLPMVTLSTTSIPFSATCTGVSSATSTITLSGAYLSPSSGSLTVTAPSNFQVSSDGSTWVSSYTISYTGSTLASTPVYAQFNPSAITTYSGSITITGGGVTAGNNVAVTGSGAAACSGTPTAGTAVATPGFGGSSTAFTLSLTGATTACGITYQWQSSSTGTGGWSNISGATLASYSFTGVTATTYYQCILTCSGSSATSGSAVIYLYPPSSCTPAFYYSTTSCSYGMAVGSYAYPFTVTGYSSTSMTDVTACSGSYQDLSTSGYTVTFAAGSSYTSTIGCNTSAYNMSYQAWIDFNNNGIFETTESVGGVGTTTALRSNMTITIPAGTAGVTAGIARMRVEAEYYYHTYPNLSPCPTGLTSASFYYGEVRDYMVTLVVPPTAYATPSSIAFPPTTVGSTSSSTTSVTGLYLTPSTGNLTVTAPTGFNVSPDGSTWASSYVISYTSSSTTSTAYVQFAPSTAATYTASVTVSGGGLSSALNIPVTGTGAAACSGTPTAGTATITPGAGTSSTSFTISLTGYTASGGIGFQWQSSADGTSWSNISGASLSSYSGSGVSTTTYYRCVVTCSYSSTSANSNTVTFYSFVPATCSTPTFLYASNACSSYNMWGRINNLVGYSGSIADGSACNGTGYENLTGTYSVTLRPFNTYNVTLQTGTSYNASQQVWIDFNSNGSFESSESVGGVSSFSNTTTTTLTIPSSATPGAYVMRLVSNYNPGTVSYEGIYPNINPCPTTSIYYGDVRDYLVIIGTLPACSGTPTAGTATASTTTGCLPYNTTLSLTGSTAASSMAYQWYMSLDGSTWNTISGATSISSLVSDTASTQYYRCIATCTVSSLTSTSTTVTTHGTYSPSGISGGSGVCPGGHITLTNSVTGGTWSSSVTSVATIHPTTGYVTGISTGTATITYSVGSCGYSTMTLSVYGTAASITGTTSVCAGATSTLADATVGGTWSSSDTTIATVTSGGVVTGVAPGTATISYSVGCGTPATASFTVNTQPAAITGASSLCISATTTMADATSGGTWSVSSTSVGTIDGSSGVFSSSTTTGTTTISYTIGSCYSTSSMSVSNTSPASITGTPVACVGGTSTLADATSGGVWSSSNTAIATVDATTGVVTGVSNGSCTITYSSGCGTPATISWTTNGTTASLSYSDGTLTGPVCSGGTLYLNSGTTSGGTYSWTGPNSFSSTSQNPTISSVTAAASGTYTFSATVGGCTSSTYRMFVAVDAVPSVTVTASPSSICAGNSTTLTDAVSAPSTSGPTVYAIPYALTTFTSSGSVSGDDVNSGGISIPFPFTFYGSYMATPSIKICTNGWVSFSSSSTTATNYAYPNSSAAISAISLVSHDLNTVSGGSITYGTTGTTPDRKFIIYYNGVANKAGGGSVTGQIILHETSNAIDIMLGSVSYGSTTYSSTTGIQNSTGSSAVTAPSRNGTAWQVSTPEGWRFVTPSYTYAWSPAGSLAATTGSSVATTTLSSTTTYSVTTVDANSGCTSGNTSTVTVTVNPLPTAMAVTGGGAYCSVPGTGVHVGLAGSESGVTYTWSNGAGSTGTIAGTGSSLDFGTLTGVGTYTVTASNATTSCASTMTGTATVTMTTSPTAYSVTGGSSCSASPLNIGLSNSESGVVYSLYNGSTYVTSYTGTGSSFSFGTYSTPGTYTVVGDRSGCTTNMTGSATITYSPAAYAVTGGSACSASGVDVQLFGSETSTDYSLYVGATYVGSMTGTGSALDFGTQTTVGVYTIIASASGCTTTMTGADTVYPTPTITLGANPSVCLPTSGSTTASISYSATTGSPTTYDITWSSAAISDGFSNLSGATLTGGYVGMSVPSTALGTYTGSMTVSNGSCTSSVYTFSVTVYAYPTAAITSVTVPCVGDATSITITGTTGASISYSVDGGTPSTATLTGGTYTINYSPTDTTHIWALLTAYNPVCTTYVDTVDTVVPTPMTWVGGTSGFETDWNTATNWSCGYVPTSANNVTIPSGTTYAPAVAASGMGYAKSLTIASGATVTLGSGAALSVVGDLTDNGTVTGTGTLTMNGTTAQAITGTMSIQNLDINNTSGVSVGTASQVNIKSTLSVTSGTFSTGDSVVLTADSTMTARVATLPSGSSITGNVRVMAYFGSGRRAYRFWSQPFNTDIPLSQLENYIDITGPGGSTNGFTTTGANAPSAYRYYTYGGNSNLASDPGWRQFASALGTPDSNLLKRFMGIRVFYRGAKGEGLGYPPYTVISATSAGQWGPLNQGDVNITLAKGSANPYQMYNMIGNPYASPVDIGTVVYNAKAAGNINGTAFYVWNPYLGTAGQFVPVTIGTGSASPYYLPACNAFQVKAQVDASQLNFHETNKSATASATLLKALPDNISLFVYDANYHPYDMTHVKFDERATTGTDNDYDATKAVGGASDVYFYSLSTDNEKMAIDARPFKANGTVPLGFHSDYTQEYIIKAEGVVVPNSEKVYLHDKFLQQYVLLAPGTEYRFNVTDDSKSQGENRFELSMSPAGVGTNGLQVTVTPNPTTDDVKIGFTAGKKNNVSIRVTDLTGVSVYSKDLGAVQNGTVTVPMTNFASGVYMVELISGNDKVTQKLIKE